MLNFIPCIEKTNSSYFEKNQTYLSAKGGVMPHFLSVAITLQFPAQQNSPNNKRDKQLIDRNDSGKR